MSNNVTETVNSKKIVNPDLVTSHPIPFDDPLLFQIFFLSQDGSQSVEVLETGKIDLEEILQRLKMGESVFIKYKSQEIIKPFSGINNEEEQKHCYFTHC
jgi:hypothetical protein